MPELVALTTRFFTYRPGTLCVFFAAALVAVFLGLGSARALDEAAGIELFEKKIRPVLVERCYKCHSARSKKLKGKLRVDSRERLLKGGESGPAVVPEKPAESLVLSALRYDKLKMPPGGKLPAAVAKDFEAWIRLGAPVPSSFGSPIPTAASNC